MRILAIRGCNLASLAGEFEIDLARSPFADTGVFAIVGNTGAGKSTLLDALCVALFDRTPRLTNHSRVIVGRGDDDPAALGAQDVRTLLRRGAAAGWAEVDFESGDARRYRARWSVRRARGQTDGALQDQQVTLTAIDGGERFGGTKTETLKAIVARLGLTFDQFRRSSLLAQGEFAAFLRADGKDRSELLERMTGTEIYSRLSVAAHVKATLAEQRFRDARAKADAIPILADDARVAAEAELEFAEDAKQASRARLGAAEAFARWRSEHRQLDSAVAAAAADQAAAIFAVEAADADRAELALRRRAEQLRGVWDEAARIDRAVSIARSELSSGEAALAFARTALDAVAERRGSLAEQHEPVRAARIAAGIVERVGSMSPVVDVIDDATWLMTHAAFAPEVAAWPENDARFTQHDTLVDAIATIDRNVRDHTAARGKLVKARELIAADLATATTKLAEAQRKAAGFAHKRGQTLDAARRQEDEARTRLADVETLVAIAHAAREQVLVRDRLDAEIADLDEHATTDAAHHTRLGVEREISLALRNERARALDDLRRAAGYAHARAELRDGESCPLCGAAEHPWKDRGSFDEVIRAEETRLVEVTTAVEASTNGLATLTAREQHRTKERERLARSRETSIAGADSAIARWREQLTSLGELLLEGDPSTTEATRIASEHESAARSRLELARLVFSQTQAATKAAQDAQAEAQLSQSNLDQVHDHIADHDRRITELDAALQRLGGERAIRTEQCTALASELAAALTRWRALAAIPDVASSSNGEQPAPKAPHAPRAVVRKKPKTDLLVASVTNVSTADLASARHTLAEVATVWHARCERVAQGDAALAAALVSIEREHRDAERAVAEHAARHATSMQRRDALITELADAGARLESARVAAGFDSDELRRLLLAEPARADELADALAALDRAVERTRVVLAERRVRLDGHLASRPRTTLRDAYVVLVHEPLAMHACDADRVDTHATARGATRAADGAADRRADARAADPRAGDARASETCGADARAADARAADDHDVDVARRAGDAGAPNPRAADALAPDARVADARAADHDFDVAGPRAGDAGANPRAADALAADTRAADDHDADVADPRAGDASAPNPRGADARADARTADTLDADALLERDADQLAALAGAVAQADHHAARLVAALAADAEARARREAALSSLHADETAAEIDRVLGEVIGSHDGKLFRSFAQSLTLDGLLAVANAHLEELAPRYQLERVPRHDLELQVIDRDFGAEVRSVQSLSGGESFLVSLALALGLSSMSAHDVRVRTLLIDEGFGTLDPATLDSALSVLDSLQATGRQVGVISHVPALVERVGAHVKVVQRGGGRSEVIVA